MRIIENQNHRSVHFDRYKNNITNNGLPSRGLTSIGTVELLTWFSPYPSSPNVGLGPQLTEESSPVMKMLSYNHTTVKLLIQHIRKV